MNTVISALRRARQIAPERVAIHCGHTEFTYGQTWDRCRRLIGALRDLGVGRGDRVAVVGPNCHRYLEIYQAIPGAGMVLVPLNHRHSAAELRYALENSGAKVLFTALDSADFAGSVEHVIDLASGYERLIGEAVPAEFPNDLTEDTVAGLFYTGGTTGVAKGVMLTHRNRVANAMHFQVCWPFTADTRWLIVAPLFHAAGSIAVLATVWNAGLQIVQPSFNASEALDLVEAHGVTATLLVPTMLAHAAFPRAQLLHIYSATETSPIATLLPDEERLLDTDQARSCGQPAVGVDVRVVGENGADLPPGQIGEVAIRGANVMVGYWNKPAETATALVEGWYYTGDVGYMDERAFLYLVDRAKDMIVSGGENVYSMEVEEVLYRHPAVREAAVFGVPDKRWGEAVYAVVVPREPVTAEELIQHCRAAIAGYKVPKSVEIRMEPLPKSGAGKVLKRELRAPHWEGQVAQVSGA